MRIKIATGLILLLSIMAAHAQSGGDFAIRQSVIASGGGGSSGGSFAVTSTVGEAFAGNVLTGGSFSIASGFWSGGTSSQTVRRTPFDFDGDSKTDIGIFRPSDGSWWYTRSSANDFRVFRFGTSADIITPGDYTGDGRADLGVFRPST